MAAFTALYVSIIFFAVPLIYDLLPNATPLMPSGLVAAVFGLGAGLWIAWCFLREQQDLARAAARLTFYEEVMN